MGKTILDTVKAEVIALGIEIDLLFQFPYDKENPQVAILKDFLEQTEKLKTDITNIIKKSSQHDIFTKEGGEDLHNQIKAHYNSLLTFKAETQNVLSRLTPNSSTSDGTQQLNPTSSANQINIQLPKLNLPKFSGQYEQWKSFSDLFIATIDKNPSLTNAQKLSYLKGSLTGDAALMIQAYTITDENYPLCFQLLKTHYDRNREIIFSFIDRLLNLNAISHVSKESLSQFSISVSDITHNLQTLGIDLKACNSFITRIIMKKVDSYSLESWLHLQTVDEVPDFNSLLKHLDVRSMALETQAKATTSSNRTNPQSSSCVKNKQVKTYTITTSNNSCPICQKQPSHRFIECEKFKSMTPIERHKKIRSLKRCFLCFSSTHLSSQCSYKPCFLCKEAHHRMLHNQPTENLTPKPNAPNPNPIANCSNSTGKILVSCHVSRAVNVTVPILSTACLNLLCVDGSVRPARFLIDSASEVSLISSQISNSLKTKIRPNPIQISGLGSTSKIDITHSTLVYLSSRFREAEFLPFEFYIVNSLQLSLPTKPVDISLLSYMGDKPLADPNFHIPGPIDGILGASACAQILTGEKFPDPNGDTALFNSKFGWLLLGSAPVKTRNVLQISDTTANPNLCSKYWELEESLNLPVPECLSVEETSFRTHTQLINHRIQVRLPLRPDHVPLGNSESKAVTLLYALERKFVRNPSYHLKYVDSMNSYLNNEHLEPVPPLELFRNDNRCFYLPHSAVPKKNSSTLRIVFNGSSTSSNGKSLNDILLTGDVLQTDIRHVLTNFRSHRFVLCMDIISMFLQILVEKNDRDLLRVLWREDSSQPISVYRFTRVPFGLSCSPFLAIRAIHYLADQFSTQYPKAAQCIKNNSYVDDFLLGADTIPELKTLVQEICLILEQGSFQFDKFSSNSVDLLEELKSQHIILDSSKVLSPGDSTVLGIDWRSQDDIFYFQLTIPNQTPNTKRGILSELQRVYDPLGFLNPCLIKFKILFQELWKDKTLDWDTPIPQTFQTSWQVYHEEVQHFKFIKIPRHLKPPDSSHYKLFGFCDASELSYACVLYIASYTHDTFLDSRFLYAKSRVKPLKLFTVPRLELLSAHLLTKAIHFLLPSIPLPIDNIICFTDSQIVLSWLHRDPADLKIFVGNRLHDIQMLTHQHNITWLHIPGTTNPADLGTRGISITQLLQSPWLVGPIEYMNREMETDTSFVDYSPQEENRTKTLVNTQVPSLTVFEKFSSFYRLLFSISVWRKFINFRRSSPGTNISPVGAKDIQYEHNNVIRYVQQKHFSEILDLLRESKPFPSKYRSLLALDPFVDDSQLLRVGGRLTHSDLPYHSKHPLLLPKDEYIVKILVEELHRNHNHCGSHLLQTIINQRYWIISSRRLVRSVIFKCVVCAKNRFNPMTQKMANLPPERVRVSKPFHITGTDYFGPLQIYYKRRRGVRPHKAYGLIFICFTTHAIHLELVADLTTNSFLLALQRFVSRRGTPAEIHCDNSTTFVGAKGLLRKEWDSIRNHPESPEVRNYSNKQLITWKHIPPYSPSFGALWESNIKSIKYLLKRSLGTSLLTYDEAVTALAKIEALLNSRPLSPLSNDPNSFEALTPGHFLIGSSLTTLPIKNEPSPPLSINKRWKYVSTLATSFWNRWNQEHLTHLQQRLRWLHTKEEPKVGQLVLLMEKSCLPGKWTMARIVEVIPGRDKHSRIVKLRTPTGECLRSISKISPLPIKFEG